MSELQAFAWACFGAVIATIIGATLRRLDRRDRERREQARLTRSFERARQQDR